MSIDINTILGSAAVILTGLQLRIGIKQERRYRDSQKTVVRCVLEPGSPEAESAFRKGNTTHAEIVIYNDSLHPIHIRRVLLASVSNQNRLLPIVIYPGIDFVHTFSKIEAQGVGCIRHEFDATRITDAKVVLTSGEELSVNFPDWWPGLKLRPTKV